MRLHPAVFGQIVDGATRLSAAFTLLCRDLASRQGRGSYPVESCSSPRVGPTDKCPRRLLTYDDIVGHQCLRKLETAASRPRRCRYEMLRPISRPVKLALVGFPFFCCTVNAVVPVYLRCRLPNAAAALSGFLMRSMSMSMRSVPQNNSSLNTIVGTPNTPRFSASSMMRSCSARASPCT